MNQFWACWFSDFIFMNLSIILSANVKINNLIKQIFRDSWKFFLQNWGIGYFATQSINRCNIGGWQVTSFLFWIYLDTSVETTSWMTSICLTICCREKVNHTLSSTTISKSIYTFWLTMFFSNNLYITFTSFINHFLSWSTKLNYLEIWHLT